MISKAPLIKKDNFSLKNKNKNQNMRKHFPKKFQWEIKLARRMFKKFYYTQIGDQVWKLTKIKIQIDY